MIIEVRAEIRHMSSVTCHGQSHGLVAKPWHAIASGNGAACNAPNAELPRFFFLRTFLIAQMRRFEYIAL